MQPATSQEILEELDKLNRHYPIIGLNEYQLQELMTDYIEDLSPYPIDLIRDACTAYRRNGKHLYFPKIGQLLEMIAEPRKQRSWQYKKINMLLEKAK
ncbi:hypothetical protein NF27_DT00180 [Candidatus Jidaibacter acanthamoeba]|uniref:Uncharacterized protein n=1 Tax=Candidatus Jidaibacter acanthamoebae TaxID=86105 RepID=A0A0C1QIC1_9RICK|nr:hypothetical protein [Candidatus Jidaibacter acanthamoeba]KIE05244.1 hypothetical protein NF27_DT00180 [Candidatus Jidaibacter acanthamoeba]